MIPSALSHAITSSLRTRSTLLLFIDFDGTLARIRRNPRDVRIPSRTRGALQALSRLPGVHIVVVSGRPKPFLEKQLGRAERVTLVGEHGSGFINLSQRLKLALVRKALLPLIHMYPGCLLEEKPSSLAFHYRRATPSVQRKAIAGVYKVVRDYYIPLEHVLRGRKVIEIMLAGMWGKQRGVQRLIKKYPRSLPLAIGDDATDEPMFDAVNAAKGISVRVGSRGTSSARYALKSVSDVRGFLSSLTRLMKRQPV